MKSWFMLVALSIPRVVTAQSEEQTVLAVVRGFFDSMESKDVAAVQQVTLPEGVFVSFRVEDGAKSIRSFSNQEFGDRLPLERSRSSRGCGNRR
jgi:hypothetical protein